MSYDAYHNLDRDAARAYDAARDDATQLRAAIAVLRRLWPDTADKPPLADIIAHLGYRANVVVNTPVGGKEEEPPPPEGDDGS